MTSPAKIAANRRNARRSTGPRSAAGKARARRNAFRHGLTTPASLDHVAMDRIDNLVDALTIDVHSQLQFQLATVAAEAQAEIERVRQTKVNLVNRASAQLREEGAGLLSAGERAALAFAGKTEILMACERYERRAISRRNRALHALAKLQRELRREEAIEVVGPPRPKSSLTRHNPFRENVLRLQVEKLMGSAPRGRVNFSCTCEWHFIKNMYGEPGKSTVGVYVTADDHHGFLHLRFEVNGEPIAQTFELACKAMRVGGVRWTVKCPESGKMVRDLYLHDRHFRSRHALGLSYCSNWPKKRHWEHAKKLMNRLGARWGESPIRPKNMQRRRFKRLADELWDAWVRDASAQFGVPLDRDALGTLMTSEVIDDIARKRVAEIALRRRRRKSSN
jgi:hypothetical protein